MRISANASATCDEVIAFTNYGLKGGNEKIQKTQYRYSHQLYTILELSMNRLMTKVLEAA